MVLDPNALKSIARTQVVNPDTGKSLDIDEKGNAPVSLNYINEPGGEMVTASTQNPFPVDGDFVYQNDIWNAESDNGKFNGNVSDLFNNLHSVISDTTSNNPKEILIHFNNTVISAAVGLGAFTGSFSNVEVQVSVSGGPFFTIKDESSDNTKRQTRSYRFITIIPFNAIKFIFHTADPISLSNCVIVKSRSVGARSFGPDGLEYAQDELTGDRIGISHPHHEIHEARNFTAWNLSLTGVTSKIIAFKVAAGTREPHMTIDWKTEETGSVIWYKGATWTPGSGTTFVPVNSYGQFEGVNTSVLQSDKTGAFVSDGIVLDPTGLNIIGAKKIFEDASWATNQSPAGSHLGVREEHILECEETFVVAVICVSGGARIGLDWYEQIPKNV